MCNANTDCDINLQDAEQLHTRAHALVCMQNLIYPKRIEEVAPNSCQLFARVVHRFSTCCKACCSATTSASMVLTAAPLLAGSPFFTCGGMRCH